MFLLDTDIVSALRRRDRANPGVLAWAASLAPADQFISAITVLEIETGILSIAHRDPAQGAQLRAWLEHRVLPALADRILPVDHAVARRCSA